MTNKQRRMEMQQHLKDTGRYSGAIDGLWGPLTEKAIVALFEDGPDTPLDDADLVNFAKANNLTFAQVKAVAVVEANGAGFFDGKPKILPEPHRFSKQTGGVFDKTAPTLSYRAWGTRPYPKTQAERYQQLLGMIKLDVYAGFASASYGKFQIMGENHKACGYSSPMLFAEAMARDEQTQLRAFGSFLKANGLLDKLRACNKNPESCRAFCRGYNGAGYEKNAYHIKLAAAIARFS